MRQTKDELSERLLTRAQTEDEGGMPRCGPPHGDDVTKNQRPGMMVFGESEADGQDGGADGLDGFQDANDRKIKGSQKGNVDKKDKNGHKQEEKKEGSPRESDVFKSWLQPKISKEMRSVRFTGQWEPKNKITNEINNQKYTVLTFLPHFLYDQFSTFFNLFFLLITVSQFFDELKVGKSC